MNACDATLMLRLARVALVGVCGSWAAVEIAALSASDAVAAPDSLLSALRLGGALAKSAVPLLGLLFAWFLYRRQPAIVRILAGWESP